VVARLTETLGDEWLPTNFLIRLTIMAQVTSFPQQDRIHVLAADNTSMNTQLLVEALARDGQFNMAGSASKTAEILACAKREQPQVALISARQGDNGQAGFDLCREICTASPATRVIMLLDSSERTPVIEAFRSGARGVFCRTESLKLLAKCILCVHEGQIWANSDELHYLLEAVAQPAPLRLCSVNGSALLSARELDVVRCVAEGLTNREIANRLTLREHTVKNYLFRIFDKLGVSSRVEVVLYALSGGGAVHKPGPVAPAKREAMPAPLVVRTASPTRTVRY
jgi:two-component system nitrate/nitrite response regulator NarL